ncbi:hypothetical protein [Thalassospira sp.]|uniref:hypothetical protein n=1 Tax=Thalassospira sp. TaxID=1912094 RepID=UPI0032EE5EC1
MEELIYGKAGVKETAFFIYYNLKSTSNFCDSRIKIITERYDVNSDFHPVSGLSIIANRIDRVCLVLRRSFISYSYEGEENIDEHQEKRTISTILDNLFVNILSAAEFSMKTYLSGFDSKINSLTASVKYSVDNAIIDDDFKEIFFDYRQGRNALVHNNGRVDKTLIKSGHFEKDLFKFEGMEEGSVLETNYKERLEAIECIAQMYSKWCSRSMEYHIG